MGIELTPGRATAAYAPGAPETHFLQVGRGIVVAGELRVVKRLQLRPSSRTWTNSHVSAEPAIMLSARTCKLGPVMMRLSLLLLFACAALAQPRRVVPLGSSGKNVALVIGNGNYRSLPRLVNGIRDAKAV